MTATPDSAAPRVSAETLRLLSCASTATLSSQLQQRGHRDLFMQHVAPLRPDLRLAGQAVTLRYIPARADLNPSGTYDNRTNQQRLAVEMIEPGDVLVIDARGDTRAGTLGNILTARIQARGAAGIVTDGAFRDAPSVAAVELPTYAGGQNANLSNQIHYPSEINVPIACGGVAVLPGDVIVGDAEGVIVIPRQLADEVAVAAAAQEELEAFIYAKVRSGSSIVGVYPPDERTLREYKRAWAANDAGGPGNHA